MKSKEQPYWDKHSLAKIWRPAKGTGRTFGQTVREMRLRLKDSTYQFAERVGSNQTSVWMCEQDRRGVRFLVAKRLLALARRHGMRDLIPVLQGKFRQTENRLGGKGWR